jgi:hypothetical protein
VKKWMGQLKFRDVVEIEETYKSSVVTKNGLKYESFICRNSILILKRR